MFNHHPESWVDGDNYYKILLRSRDNGRTVTGTAYDALAWDREKIAVSVALFSFDPEHEVESTAYSSLMYR